MISGMKPVAAVLSVLLLIAIASCRPATEGREEAPSDVGAFLKDVNETLGRLGVAANEAQWVQETYITPDTEALAARATEAYVNASTDYARKAAAFPAGTGSGEEQRQLTVLRNTLTVASPTDAREAEELTRLTTAMSAAYGRGKYCPGEDRSDETCLDIEEITKIMAESRDARQLRDVWEGWHTIAPPLKPDYARFVELSNKGARELGFADTGAMWRSRYDMAPDQFAREIDRLWTQLQPLYLSLHAYVRARLRGTYGDQVPADGPIPAHLLGNIWAQDWSNVETLVAPRQGGRGVDLTGILKAKSVGTVDMVRYGERFFTSLGFEPLPMTFWQRSLFVKPRDRDVMCHASAWDIDLVDDLRIKMCIDQTGEDFTTIHHELGHNFYQRAYKTLPVVFRDSPNDGFHEAIGDTIALSVTPEYLVKIGLLDRAPDASGDIALLLSRALEKIAFLPFGVVIDQWRWRVFSGEVGADSYNRAWWELRERYQGVRAPSPRDDQFFDPGAKYHVPANTPYARYFLASVLQFQFHRALAKAAGCSAPLHRCSIYGSAEAGKRLRAALDLGASRPWPEVLEVLTGERQMDATAIADYFAPLKTWLDEQNSGQKIGW